jgi:hypothetical protein
MAASIVVVWCTVTVVVLTQGGTSLGQAMAVGAYAAFWLGGGFGTVFSSAAIARSLGH